MYARVVVDTGATSSIDSLTYEIPDGLMGKVGIGACVLVPLGPRQAVGYVIGFEDQPAVENTKKILTVVEGAVTLSEDMLRLAQWVSDQYLCPLPRTVISLLPGILHSKIQTTVKLTQGESDIRLTPAEHELLTRLRESGDSLTVDSLCQGQDRPTVLRLLRQLEAKSILKREWKLLEPSGKPKVLRGVRLVQEVTDSLLNSLTAKQSEAVKAIVALDKDTAIAELGQRYGISRAVLTALESKGVVESVDVVFRRNPTFAKLETKRFQLNDEQQKAVDEITATVSSGKYGGHMLFGVTASGKTEVYLRCIEHTLNQGRTSLVLLPEIALTTQVMNIFKSRFGDEVAVLHSALSDGERCDEWHRIQSGEAKIVLGARSAVFAPLFNIGLVIVDEEHEGSYKQHDTPPRYNARDVAVQRAKDAHAALVLGSATPCIETFYQANNGGFKLIIMQKRIENRPMPTVYVADLRREGVQGQATIFSKKLEDGIRDRLAKGEQVMLLQNRRAYSTFLLCRDCGHVMRCPNCAVSLKYHMSARKLSCHHCDFECGAPDTCPQCEGTKLKRFGIGTERVEEETRKTFPDAKILRMDRDTTSRKGAHGAILHVFRQGEADILVGTQMIAKGLDFPNVTLVGIISADTSLNLPDFRACERTYQLVSQVAGRAGRGKSPGEVVIQTFDPDNYALKNAVDHDYVSFYEQEVEMREELKYPPFGSIVNIISRDEDERAAIARLNDLVKAIKSGPMSQRMGIEIIGPNQAVLAKLRNEYRWHLVLRSSHRNKMLDLLRAVLDKNPNLRRQISVDVDPASML